MRAAQEIRGCSSAERSLQRFQVQFPAAGLRIAGQRRFDGAPPGEPDGGEERRVDRRVHHHAVADVGEQLQCEVHPTHDVEDDRDPRWIDVHVPPAGGEGRVRLRQPRRSRVARVAVRDHPVQHIDDGLGQREVHLRHPHGQHVRVDLSPLLAPPQAKLVERQRIERMCHAVQAIRCPRCATTVRFAWSLD